MRHDLVTLELVLFVSQAKSITGGAVKANMALAAASKRISDYEARLGVRLFRRTGRGVYPTDECLLLLQHIAAVRQALDRLDEDAFKFCRTVNGTIRVALTAEASACGVAEELARFGLAHPEVRYVIHEACTAAALQAVAVHDCDLAIALAPDEASGLVLRPYGSGQWNILLPLNHRLAPQEAFEAREIDVSAVALDEVVHFPEGLTWTAHMGNNAHNLKARTHCVEVIFAMVESGLGVAIVTDALARRAMLTHSVKRCALRVPPYALALATASDESQSFALRSLLKFLSGRDALPPSCV